MNLDAELDIWRDQWQSERAVPVDLRESVERQSRWMRLALAGEVLVTVVMGGATSAWAMRVPQPDIVLLAVATWMFLTVAWILSLRANRGTWSLPSLDTSAFLSLSIHRCRARLSAIRYAAILFVCELVFCLAWVYFHLPEPRLSAVRWLFFSSTEIDVVWLCTAVFFGYLVWYRRKKQRELAYLLSIETPIV